MTSPSKSGAISLRGLSIAYGDQPVLKALDLEIAAGEFVALVGPSGCGKSSLLRAIAGLETPATGRIFIDGREVTTAAPSERGVAMVFQQYALYPHMTVAQNIATPLRMQRLRWFERLPFAAVLSARAKAVSAEIAQEVEAIGKMLRLTELMARRPRQLSGGQQQRVALGRAMVRHPAAFLMDEPLSNLDAELRARMRREIAALHRRLGAAMLFVTHDQAEAMTLADRVGVLVEGRLLQLAPPWEVYSNPADLKVAQLIGAPRINVLPAVVDEARRLRLGAAAVQVDHDLPAGAAVQLAVRSEHVSRAAPSDGTLTGAVTAFEHLGSDVLVTLLLDGGEIVYRDSPEATASVALGDRVSVRLNTAGVLLFDSDGRRIARPPAPSLQGAAAAVNG